MKAMNNTSKSLLELYQLLWEQIKDKLNVNLIAEILELRTINLITEQELKNMTAFYINGFSFYESQRENIQRMIKELENDK